MKDIYKSLLYGFIFAASVLVYVGLIAWIMSASGPMTGKDVSPAWGAMLALLLFCFSAAVVGTLTFGRPVYLLLEKKVKEAVMQLLFILAWLLLFFIVAYVIIAL